MIYLAAPLFSAAERSFNKELARRLTEKLDELVALPQEFCEVAEHPQDVYKICVEYIRSADLVIALMDGSDVDSGTAWEIGFATAKNIPVLGIRTDTRQHREYHMVNTMLAGGCTAMLYTDPNDMDMITRQLIEAVKVHCPRLSFAS